MSTHRSPRAGFTLIEILVVLAIIGILVALAGVAYFRFVGGAQEKTTKATIETAYGVFKKQWAHVIAEARKEPIPDAIRLLTGPDTMGNGQDQSGERARVALIKLRLAEAFPQSYQDISDFSNQSSARYLYRFLPKPNYMQTYVSKWKQAGGKTGTDPKTESAACLLLALTTAKGGVQLDLDKVPTKPLDTDSDGLPELCDAWGHPIAFFRFPHNNAKLAAAQPSMTGPKGAYTDPLDPLKMLQTWVTSNDLAPQFALVSNRTGFENIIQYPIGNPPAFTTPVFVSAGRDEVLDLNFFDMLPTSPKADDNLYSFAIVPP